VNVLLDTHVLIWWIENSRRLGKRTKSIILNDRTTVWVSAATILEIGIKAGMDRLDVSPLFLDELVPELSRSSFRSLPIQFDHAFTVRALPPHHRDPFDRILVAQAQCEGLTLVTADPLLPRYPIPTLDASA
jgi:PIN domain nuclease of toxin-antitoxin system